MVDFIESLLINFLFILFPIFVYHLFASTKYVSAYKTQIITILASLSVIFCMEFGIEIIDGYYYDLRLIPLILCILYGGYKTGLGVVFLSLVYRYMIGGQGFIVSLILFAFVLVTVSLISNKFRDSTAKNKIILSVTISIIFSLLVLISSVLNFGLLSLTKLEWVGVILIQILGTAFTTYIIETLQNTVRLQKEAVENEKLKVVSSLAASIAHEIRNPLTVTKGFLQLLKETNALEQEKKEYIDFALNEVENANKIITDYLIFAKPEVQKIEKVDVSKELSNSVALIKPLANMNNIIIKKNISGPVEIMGDSGKLNQCFINIMKNSVEAMKDNKRNGVMEILLERANNHVEITFRDNGIGMTNEEVGRLGTPFFSTKDQGTGLGMMVVFSLVKAMGGKISVTSEKFAGTTLTMTYPFLKRT